MKNILRILVLLTFLNASAQNLNYNSPLPIDKSFKTGVLSNGMTYYLKSTDVTKGVASYYIIQNVGSILEEDNQQGLAHFLEHMAFNGTKNFKGKGILNTMQKHGLVFGKDINAYTSFDETVYNVNNIPTTPELIDTGLLILHDWSNFLLLSEEEIDAERGVIKEEWRTRQNGAMRVFQKSLKTMFNNSKYAYRLPIGQMDIVENFEYKALKDFYHDWYRTDLQAIAVIGDIDIEVMEQKIKALFSKIPAIDNPKKRLNITIPNNDKMLYSLVMDEEVTTSSISLGFRHPNSLVDQTVADLKTNLLNTMVINMLSKRLKELSIKPDASFLGTTVNFGQQTRTSNVFKISMSPKPDKQHEAFKDILKEVNRAVKFGFANGEIQRTIALIENYYENQIKKEEDRSHSQLISIIKNHYLNNITIKDLKQEYNLVKLIIENLTSKELHDTIKKLYSKKNRFLIVTGLAGKHNLSKEEALSIINEIEQDETLVAYKDDFIQKGLLEDTKIILGTIIKEEKNEDLGATTFFLSNGVKLHYKFVDKNKNDVQLYAISEGGMSLLKDDDIPSANLLENVVQYSGLGNYSATDLTKILSGKTARSSIKLGSLHETLSGAAVTKDVETMLQLTHLRFVKPRFDEDGFNVIMQNVKNYQIKRSEAIGEKIKDSMIVTLYGENNPKHRLFDDNFIKDISFEKIKTIYRDRFDNVSDFEFFIVGDIEIDKVKPLITRYIASIPSNLDKEKWKDNSTNWLKEQIKKDIYLKMEDPKSSVRIAYKKDTNYSIKSDIISSVLGDILKLRFTDTLREEEGGTYGASASSSVSKMPKQVASLSISFDCNPEKVETLVGIVHNEVEKIANGDVNQGDLNKTITNYIKQRKQQKDYNSYDLSRLVTFFRDGYDIENPKNFETIVNSITKEDIQNFTKDLITDSKFYQIVFRPINQAHRLVN